MKKNNLSEDDLPQTVKNIRNNQLMKLYNQIGALAKKHPNNIKKEDIPQYINEQTNCGNKYNVIAYFTGVILSIEKIAENV